MISYMVVAIRDKRRVCVIGVFICLYIYMCVWCTFMFYLLAYPICLCLAMIVTRYTWADDVAGGAGEA